MKSSCFIPPLIFLRPICNCYIMLTNNTEYIFGTFLDTVAQSYEFDLGWKVHELIPSFLSSGSTITITAAAGVVTNTAARRTGATVCYVVLRHTQSNFSALVLTQL